MCMDYAPDIGTGGEYLRVDRVLHVAATITL
jgi:hypothetical protein